MPNIAALSMWKYREQLVYSRVAKVWSLIHTSYRKHVTYIIAVGKVGTIPRLFQAYLHPLIHILRSITTSVKRLLCTVSTATTISTTKERRV